MMQDKQSNVHISKQVIAKIAAKGIQEAQEIIALMDGRIKRTDKNKFYKAVRINIREVEIAIEVYPVVQFGVPLHLICRTLQLKLKQMVEKMTGLIVSEININVVGVEAV